MSDLSTLYKDIILEHSQSPRNFGALQSAQLSREGFNPLCGDQIRIDINLNSQGDHVEKCAFIGKGCAICMASASILMEEAEAQPVSVILEQIKNFRAILKGERDESEVNGDLQALLGVKQFPVRIKCALLPWVAMAEALSEDKNGSSITVSRTE